MKRGFAPQENKNRAPAKTGGSDPLHVW